MCYKLFNIDRRNTLFCVAYEYIFMGNCISFFNTVKSIDSLCCVYIPWHDNDNWLNAFQPIINNKIIIFYKENYSLLAYPVFPNQYESINTRFCVVRNKWLMFTFCSFHVHTPNISQLLSFGGVSFGDPYTLKIST